MSKASLDDDLSRLRRAIRHVMDAARAESVALDRAAASCTDETMEALRKTHLEELDSVQALVASLELFDRRLMQKSAA